MAHGKRLGPLGAYAEGEEGDECHVRSCMHAYKKGGGGGARAQRRGETELTKRQRQTDRQAFVMLLS